MRQDHTANHYRSVWWRLLRAGLVVINPLRTVGGQTPSDLRRKKAFWIALCVWGVGAVALWWLGRRYVNETTGALFAGAGFLVGFFYIFALGPLADFIERRMHISHVRGERRGTAFGR
jgi:Na+/melibiose symporter-like transporter